MRRLLIAWCALLTMQTATACSCEFQDDAGFIHAKLQRLPAHARGALFQLPYGSSIKLDAGAFTIVSDRQPQPLKAEISWPTLGIAAPDLLLPALTTLLKLALRSDRAPRACIDEATLRWKDQLAWTLHPVLTPVQQGLRPLTRAMNLVAEALVDALAPSPLSHQQK